MGDFVPLANRTFVYNIVQDDWSEWGRGILTTRFTNASLGTRTHTPKRGLPCGGDFRNGMLYKLTRDVHTDNGDPVR